MKRTVHRKWALSAVGMMALAVLAGARPAGAGEAIKLGAVVPLTGRYGATAPQIRGGYEIAIETINRAGGVSLGARKLPLELVLLDDESDSTKTVARLETLAGQGVIAYLGGLGSDLHAAAAAIAEKNKTPYCGVGFALYSIHQHGYKYLFSPFWKSPDITRATFQILADTVPEAQRARKVGIFQEKTDWGKEMADLWEKEAAANGTQVVVRAEYAVGAKDFSDMILKAKGAGVEMLLAVPTPPDGMAIVKQLQELDFAPKASFFFRAPDPPVWSRNLGKAGDYMTFGPGWHHAVKYPGVAELNEAHQKRAGRPADPAVGPSYACIQLYADAIQRAGSLDKGKIRDAMAASNMMTVAGPVRFNPDGTSPVRAVLVQWLQGKQELVWPKEFATKPFGYPAPPFAQR